MKAFLLHLVLFLGMCVVSLDCSAAAPFGVSIRYERGETNQNLLTWDAIPGRLYNVFSADQLSQPSWSVLNSALLVAETNSLSYRDTNLVSSRFYRIKQESATVVLLGIGRQDWQASDDWVPAIQSHAVSGSNMLITLGAWWDGGDFATDFVKLSRLPTDTIGLFTGVVTNGSPYAEDPVRTQIALQASPAPGLHAVTPPPIGVNGDGFFVLVEVGGLATNAPVRDTGHARVWHPFLNGAPDPNSIETITVSTDGTAAQVGDLAVAVFVMDNNVNSDIQISLPTGWTSLGFNNEVVDNIGYRACFRIVTEAGRQTATCSWTDNTTFVAEGAIAVFKPAGQ